MTPLKRHFLKDFSPDFAEFWREDVKLMRNKIRKFRADVCLRFLFIEEVRWGEGV